MSRHEDDGTKIVQARELIGRLAETVSLIAPAQTLGELFVVLRGSGASRTDARTILLELSGAFGIPLRSPARRSRLLTSVDHGLQFWDALIVTAAAEASCALLLSDDMQHGFVMRGLTIINPLAAVMHPKLATLLEPSAD